MIDYPNIHLVVYPGGAGGKFLINCLSLNDKTVFQLAKLAKQQIDNNFSLMDKYNYLMEKLESAKKTEQWTDLDLGSKPLFGPAIGDFGVSNLEVIEKKVKATEVFRDCISNKLNMFLISNNLNEISQKRTLFPNGKIVVLKNFKNFLSLRKRPFIQPELNNYWAMVRDPSWPEHPPATPKEFYNLEPRIQDELCTYFNGDIFKFLDYTFEDYTLWDDYNFGNAEICYFDVDLAYSHQDHFYTQYTNVCKFLDVPPFDKKMIDRYFSVWLQTIMTLGFLG